MAPSTTMALTAKTIGLPVEEVRTIRPRHGGARRDAAEGVARGCGYRICPFCYDDFITSQSHNAWGSTGLLKNAKPCRAAAVPETGSKLADM